MKYSLKEKILLYKIRNNKDAESYAGLYDMYVDKIYRFIFFKVSKMEEAQDLCSEVFLKTWQYLLSDKKVKNFQALIYQIARHVIIDFYRKKSFQQTRTEEELLSEIEEQKSLAEHVEKKLEFENIEKLLRKLKDEYREILTLKFIEELSIDEISKIIEKSKGNVRVMLHRALKALKELTEEAENKK